MSPLDFRVSVDPEAPAVLPDTITFETGASLQQVADPTTYAYNHHGEGFGAAHPGALTAFFEDLVLGRPLPLRMVSREIGGVDTVVAFALFLHRELAVAPRMPGLVATADFIHRRGETVLGHVDPELEHLVYLLNEPDGPLSDWLPRAIGWVRDYVLEGRVPGTLLPADVRELDRGTNGFVVARSTEARLHRAWVELYRRGHLRGVLFGPEDRGFVPVMLSRKSAYVGFDLALAASILNEMELATGWEPSWTLDGLWLSTPGTILLPEHVLQVALRVLPGALNLSYSDKGVPKLTLVTIGSNGPVDYLETPDGVRYTLGTTSVLQLISRLVSGRRFQREALEAFNQGKEAAVLLDLDAFFEMQTPRARWASNSSLFPRSDRTLRGTSMNTADLMKRIACCEQQVALLDHEPSPENQTALIEMVASISLPNFGDQSKNDAFDGMGKPKVDTMEDPGAYTPPANITHPLGKQADLETLQTNLAMAETIVQKVHVTDEKIDAMVTAGRRFNASKARNELHTIVATLVSMLKQVDPAHKWVTAELQKIDLRAAEIHDLFAPVKI